MTISPAQLHKEGFSYWKQIAASGLYTGLSPFASGTVASAVAALLYFVPGGSNFWVLLILGLAAFIGGIPLAAQAEEKIGKDPSFVTLDEFSGQWLTLASPFVLPNPYWVLLCFLIFRLFDIAKIWPASYFDRRPGGLGIMADDVVSAVYANLVCHLLWFGGMFLYPVLDFLQIQI